MCRTTVTVRGHILANVDPLDLKPREHPDLNLEQLGLTIWDLDREFLTLGVCEKPIAPLRELLERLRDTYCRRTGVEYMHIADVEQRRWLQARVEKKPDPLSIEDKRQILYNHVKYGNQPKEFRSAVKPYLAAVKGFCVNMPKSPLL